MSAEESQRQQLITTMLELMPQDGSYHIIPGLQIHRISQTNTPVSSVPTPAFCVIAQGRKEVHFGRNVLRYDPDTYLASSVDLPVTSQIVRASPEHPYLSIRMELDPTMIAAVAMEIGDRATTSQSTAPLLDVGPFDASLRDAVIRLMQVARDGDHIDYLIPHIQKEIVYRLLIGHHGALVQHLALRSESSRGITRAIELIRYEYHQPLRIEQVAEQVSMSVSGFHHQFKIVTGMSPLQFQKQLRLHEARRLMLAEGFDATRAGLQVGYRNPSQFNREYRRQFGEPPVRDIERLKLSSGLSEEYELRPLLAMNDGGGADLI